ncbi:MAG: PrsW family intramembrane metalloprotease [Candidatus Pacebacteria bacterium]|nr:PrsW family intramembrane metalloprotease [Candidatus Paceibacterota bacterium]
MNLLGIEFNTLVAAALGGIVPTILWLKFWWRDDGHDHGKGIIILTFVAGMVSVIVALPSEQFIAGLFYDINHTIISAATIEEFLKFIIVAMIAFGAYSIKGPTDYARYLITGALGFAALENTLFLIEPIVQQDFAISFLTGNLRFLGATVLHTVASASIGVVIGLAWEKSYFSKLVHAFFGLLTAVTLHTLFNFFIIKGTTQSMITVFALLWVSAIVLLVIFEKLNQVSRHKEYLINKLQENHYV